MPLTDFVLQLKNYMMAAHASGATLMDLVAAMEECDFIDLMDAVESGDVFEDIARDLCTALAKLASGQASTIVRATGHGEGVEAWSRLLRERDPKNSPGKKAATSSRPW